MSDWDNEWSGTDSYSSLCEHKELEANTKTLKKKLNFRLSKTDNCTSCEKWYRRGFDDTCREGFYIGWDNNHRSTCDKFRRKE